MQSTLSVSKDIKSYIQEVQTTSRTYKSKSSEDHIIVS